MLVDALDEGFVFQDGEGRVVFANPAASRILGLTPDQLDGRTAYTADWHTSFEDGTVDADRTPSVIALRTGRPVKDVVLRVSNRVGREVWISVSARPVFDAPGTEPSGVVVSFTDVTESRAAQAALRTAERKYRQIVELAREGIWTIDADARVTYVNERLATLLGHDPTRMVGRPVIGFVAAADRELVARALEDRRNGKSGQYDVTLVRADGSLVWTIISSSPIFADDGGYAGAVAMVTDVSERREVESELRDALLEGQRQETELERTRLESELAKAQRLESLGRLSGGIAHDFNNLLGVIINYTNFVAKGLDTTDPLLSDVTEISKAAERATDLTRQLLLFGRREVVREATFDLGSVVRALMPMFRRTFRSVELDLELAAAPTPVRADRGQIEQVLMNLLLNARDAMPEGGTVLVRVARRGDLHPGRVELAVRDAGEGMSPDVLEQAFEPFFTTKLREQGSGLGLASVHGIVTRAGGGISINSQPGTGTTVTVQLPLAVVGADEGGADDADGGVLEGERPETGARVGAEIILVVDDEPEVRAVTTRILREGGYYVLEASSGPDALHQLMTDAADTALLVTDVVMPEMSGAELAREVHSLRPAMRVLLTSGYAHDALSPDDSLRDELLAKPFNEEQLLRAVRRALEPVAAA